jgi:hypothetical protein
MLTGKTKHNQLQRQAQQKSGARRERGAFFFYAYNHRYVKLHANRTFL